MTVGVERDCYGGVPQHLRHLLRVHVAAEQQARGWVSKIVEPNRRKPRRCQKRPQFAVELHGMQVTARCSTEHQIAIDPERPGVQTLLHLMSSVLAKRINREGPDLHPAPRPG